MHRKKRINRECEDVFPGRVRAPPAYELPSHRTLPAGLQSSFSLTLRCTEGGGHDPPSAETGTARGQAGGPGPREGLAVHRAGGWPGAARARRADPGSPRPRADTGENSREHRDGRPHHAVGKAAPLHVHGAAARAAGLLLVRLGRRRRLHFRHPGRGWLPRQQERRNPFRFRHAVRAPLRPAPARSLVSAWRHFREAGSSQLGLPTGNWSRVPQGLGCLAPGPRRPPALRVCIFAARRPPQNSVIQ